MHARSACSGLMVVLAALGAVVVPGTSAPAALAAVTPTDLPPSAPGRLAYSTGVYESSSSGQGMTVHGLGAIGLDGTDQRTLTEPPTGEGAFDHSPQWSPDGTWLAYLQDRPDPDGSGSIDSVAVIPRDGGSPQILDSHGWGPAWSPDGLHLAWVSVTDAGDDAIVVADVVATSTAVTVVDRRAFPVVAAADTDSDVVGWPVFSPDGLTLAFGKGNYVGNDDAQLYTMSVADGAVTKVSHGVGVAVGGNGAYTFSPDGTKLLFLADTTRQSGAPQAYIVNRDGSDQHLIYQQADRYVFAATWSPVGDTVALVTNSPWRGVLILGLDGALRSTLAQNTFQDWGGLTYAPDGSRLYTVASPGGPGEAKPWVPDLYAIPVNGDPVQRLTTDQSVFPGTVQAVDPGRVIRQFGDGEVATAVAGVTHTVRSADTVVLADAGDYAGTLAVAPLAAALHAPTLVTAPDHLAPAVRRALKRLQTRHVVVAGDVSSSVVDALRAGGWQVSRVAHTGSAASAAAAVARRLGRTHVLLVPHIASENGAWRLPLAASAFAAFKRWPMLYSRHSSLPAVTASTIRDLGISDVTVVGDDKAVRPRLLQQLAHLGVKVHRVRTSNPYAVSALFAQRARDAGAHINHPVVASGAGWSRSIAAPALAAILGQINVLVDSRSIANSAATGSWLADHRRGIRTARLVGGVGAIRPRVEAQLEHRV